MDRKTVSCRRRRAKSSTTQNDNWLTRLDREAAKWQQASDWLEYDDFVLSRFPHLRPPSKGNQNLTSGTKSFNERISIWKGQISRSVPSVMAGLTESQQEQLAALLSDCEQRFSLQETRDKQLEYMMKEKPEYKGMKQRKYIVTEKEARSRQRILRSKFEASHSLLEDLQSYASNLEAIFDTVKLVESVRQCLHLLDQARPLERPPEYFKEIRDSIAAFFPHRVEASTFNMVSVFFFLYECTRSENEAEVRTGQIHNTLWHRWTAKPVDVREHGVSRGCSVVHVAVRKSASSMPPVFTYSIPPGNSSS